MWASFVNSGKVPQDAANAVDEHATTIPLNKDSPDTSGLITETTNTQEERQSVAEEEKQDGNTQQAYPTINIGESAAQHTTAHRDNEGQQKAWVKNTCVNLMEYQP
jgi:hypothetical protein